MSGLWSRVSGIDRVGVFSLGSRVSGLGARWCLVDRVSLAMGRLALGSGCGSDLVCMVVFVERERLLPFCFCGETPARVVVVSVMSRSGERAFFGFDHINRNPPVLIRTPKLTRFEPA